MRASMGVFTLLVLAVFCLSSTTLVRAAPLAGDYCPDGSGMVNGSCRCSPVDDVQACSDDRAAVLKCASSVGIWMKQETCEEGTSQCRRVRKRSNNEVSYRCRVRTPENKLGKRCAKKDADAAAAAAKASASNAPVADGNPAGDDA